MSILDGASFWRNTLVPQVGNGQAAAKRIPFTFTSTYRLLKSGGLESLGTDSAMQKSQSDRARVLAQIEADGRGAAIANMFGGADIRTMIQSVSRSIVGTDMPIINMAVNPQSISWSQNKRIVKRDTMSGSTFFHFTDSVSRNNDILKLTFSGKTGNINVNTANNAPSAFINSQGGPLQGQIKTAVPSNPITSPLTNTAGYVSNIAGGASPFVDGGTALGAVKAIGYEQLESLKSANGLKLRTWHELYNLTREQVLIMPGDSGVQWPTKNEFFISYRTALFPVPIVFIGFFDSVLSFTESAADPFNRDYTFSFTVTDSSPKLDDIAQRISSNLAFISATGAAGK